jgi:hypothetical protein
LYYKEDMFYSIGYSTQDIEEVVEVEEGQVEEVETEYVGVEVEEEVAEVEVDVVAEAYFIVCL